MATTYTRSQTNPIRRFERSEPQVTGAVNVGEVERLVSVMGGSALALYGLSRESLGGLALAFVGGGLICRGIVGHCAVYEALGLNTAQSPGQPRTIPPNRGIKVERSVTINRPVADLYREWRDLARLPRIMTHLKAVEIIDERRSRWIASGPMGQVSWEAEIVKDRPNEMISWQSLSGSDVDTAGSVHFQPAVGVHGTVLRVVLKYDPPAGKLGATVAKFFGEAPEQQICEDLRRFKEAMETRTIA